MSRSHVILAAALAGVLGLGGVARFAEADDAPVVVAVGPEVPLADAVRAEIGLEPVVEVDPNCSLTATLVPGADEEAVMCLESQLIAVGVLLSESPDTVFDEATEAAVRSFQDDNGLAADGVVSAPTAERLVMRLAIGPMAPDPSTCPNQGRAAVIDRFNQRNWLCTDGEIESVMPMSSAVTQPDPGTYEVYAKDLEASSTLTGAYSTMTHFVAFTYGKYQGARIAFHSIPEYPGGGYVQPLDSVGTEELFGDSSGCIRVLPADAERIWDWLDVGDEVIVVT